MRRFTLIIILIFLLVANSLCSAQTSKGMKRPQNQTDLPDIVYRKGWALVIGINKYPNLPSQYQLNYSVADAEAVADLFQRKYGFEREDITVLKDEQATKAKIMEKLHSFADTGKVSHEDCVIVYFSGHGQTVSLPKSSGEMGFIIPYDAKIGDLHSEPNMALYMQYCIAMSDINQITKTIPAKHIMFIVDACYSGLVLTSQRGLPGTIPNYLKTVAKEDTEQMITAGGKGETSEERPDIGHGVFTYKLLKGLDNGLADNNNDGVITGQELSTYLTNAVREMTNGKQNPRFGKAEEGEFLFIIQKREPVKGKLVVQVYPSDAVITVNPLEVSGEGSFCVSAGETEVPVGTYNLTAEKDGYETLSKPQVKVTATTPAQVKLTLKQKPPVLATVDDKYLTQDIQVFINGSRVKLPYKTVPGTYTIHLERSGYDPVDMNITLATAQTFSPKPEWVPIPIKPLIGTFQVQVNPVDARVSVTSLENTKNYDLTSNEIELPPGRYVATAKKNDYYSEVQDFKITANQKTPLILTLKPKQPEKAPSKFKSDAIQSGSRVSAGGSSVVKGQKGIPRPFAFGASMVIPGLGQHLQGHKTRGFINEGMVIGTGIFALVANSRHHSTRNDYIAVRNELENKAKIQMRMTSEVEALFREQEDKYNKATSAKNLAIVAQLMFFTAWGVNAFDAGFLAHPAENSSGLAMDIQPISDGAVFIVKASF
jgi:uncharacterized caspase-like protein